MSRWFAIIAALLCAIGVIIGAFGAHALSDFFVTYPQSKALFKTAHLYHMIHALGLFIIAWASQFASLARYAGYCMITGLCLFSGSLYALSITQIKWLGVVTPLGGVMLILAWLFLAYGLSLIKQPT